jgi:hypothetical protein
VAAEAAQSDEVTEATDEAGLPGEGAEIEAPEASDAEPTPVADEAAPAETEDAESGEEPRVDGES